MSTTSGRGHGPRGRGTFHPQDRGQFQGPPRRGPSDAPRAAYRGARGRGRPGAAIFVQDKPSTIDARIKNGSDKAVVARLSRSGVADDVQPSNLPPRPDFGTRGREIALRASYFPVTVEGKIYRYSVATTLPGRTLSRRVKHRVFQLAEQTEEWHLAGLSGHVAHDNAERLVASTLLPQPLIISGTYYDEDQDVPPSGRIEYTLTITFEEEVGQETLNECLAGQPVDSQALAKVLSALNLVLTAHTSRPGIKLGRDDDKKKHPDQRLFFDAPDPKDIGGGLNVREGFYVSVRPAHQQLMINMNTCHAAFYKPQNFVDALAEYRRFTNGDTGAFGIQVRVTTKPKGRIVMIRGISNKTARRHTFPTDTFGKITVAEYYKRKHNIVLEYPDLSLLEGQDGNFYPPEVCDILPDQGFKGKLSNNKHAKAMLDAACKPPKENAEEIVHRGVDMLGFRDSNLLLESFGVTVSPEMAVVPGRVLEKPGLTYLHSKPATIDGRASWNLRDVKFAVGARLDRWAVLVIQDGGQDDFRGPADQELRKIVNEFCNMCNKSGMQVRPLGGNAYGTVQLPPRGKDDRFRDTAIEKIEQVLVSLMRPMALELVLVALSNDDEAIYNGIKRVCDIKLDVATVCMQSQKVRKDKGRLQYLANIALKVNMKLGGINHKLDANSGVWLKTASTMVMGMDVTHPARGPSAEGTPSIVAVVASVDQHYAQYPATLALRGSKVEIDRDHDSVLKNMFVSRFELYKARNNGNLPKRVILYRDGVSESQFMQVRQHELIQMKAAFEHFAPYQPKLSIVVCGKRHNTRFYPTRQQDAADDGNPLPGTVVDRGITPAYEFDFFLQAHAGLKGTTRPTHYFVVHDENGFTADELQRVTNDLSYMFSRATKAVSLVSPAYWADIACERGRCYLHKLLMRHQGDAETKKGKEVKGGKKGKKQEDAEDTIFEEAARIWGNGVSGPNLRDTMFYL